LADLQKRQHDRKNLVHKWTVPISRLQLFLKHKNWMWGISNIACCTANTTTFSCVLH